MKGDIRLCQAIRFSYTHSRAQFGGTGDIGQESGCKQLVEVTASAGAASRKGDGCTILSKCLKEKQLSEASCSSRVSSPSMEPGDKGEEYEQLWCTGSPWGTFPRPRGRWLLSRHMGCPWA